MQTWAHFYFYLCKCSPGLWDPLLGHSHKHKPAGCGSVGSVRRSRSISEEKAGRADKAGWKQLSSGVLFRFICFCSFSLALCTELEVWHFQVSFYRNKCQERWVILISLKINPGCQRNQNFVLKFSLQESKSLPTLWVVQLLAVIPEFEGSMGLEKLKIDSRKSLGFGLSLTGT